MMKKINLKKLIKLQEKSYRRWLLLHNNGDETARPHLFKCMMRAETVATALRCLQKIVKARKHCAECPKLKPGNDYDADCFECEYSIDGYIDDYLTIEKKPITFFPKDEA